MSKQVVELEHAGEKLEGLLYMPENGMAPFPAVIFFHGLTSSQKKYVPIAQVLAQHGIAGFTVNVRGHGHSGGDLLNLTAAELESDGISAYDYLIKQAGIDFERIGICGGSWGALLGVNVASVRQVRSLLLRAPATYTEEMRHTQFTEIIAKENAIFHGIIDPTDTQAVRTIRDYRGSLLVIASGNDGIIPRTIPQTFFDNALHAKHREFEIMNKAPHSLNAYEFKKEFSRIAVKWFQKTL